MTALDYRRRPYPWHRRRRPQVRKVPMARKVWTVQAVWARFRNYAILRKNED